jgi:hypothetical protein
MGYNKGDNYEQNIFDLLTSKGLIATGSARGGAGNSTDIKFLCNFQEYDLEVKLDLGADYGQKMLRWDDGIWSWCVDDPVTAFYTSVGVLDIVNAKNFISNRYSIPRDEITMHHKKQDQKAFEDKVEIDINTRCATKNYETTNSSNCKG